MRLTDKQVVGVRAFACLLGLTVEQLRARYRLTLAQERALELEVVLSEAAGRVRRERGLADDKLVAGFVLMDEINSAVMQYRQLIGDPLGVGLAPIEDGEVRVKRLIEATTSLCVTDGGGSSGPEFRQGLVGQLVVAGTSLANLRLYPMQYKTVEVVMKAIREGVENGRRRFLDDRLSKEASFGGGAVGEGWQKYTKSREYRAVLQYLRGLPQILEFLAKGVAEPSSQARLQTYVNGIIGGDRVSYHLAELVSSSICCYCCLFQGYVERRRAKWARRYPTSLQARQFCSRWIYRFCACDALLTEALCAAHLKSCSRRSCGTSLSVTFFANKLFNDREVLQLVTSSWHQRSEFFGNDWSLPDYLTIY
jgi:hypothetical protein